MKKGCLMLLCACLSAACALAEPPTLSVADLRAQTPARWTQTYHTPWRDVEIDAPVILPDVSAVPVLQIGYDTRAPRLSAADSGWDSVESRGGMLILCNNDPAVPRSADGRKIDQSQEASGQWYDGFAPENAYVPMSDTPFGDICAMINAELTEFGCDPADFRVASPLRLWAQHWYYDGKKEDALPGTVLMEIARQVNGLPILGHAYFAVTGPGGERRSDEYWEYFRSSAGYDGYSGRLTHLFISAAKVTDALAEDVPLCAFDAVRKAVEPLVVEGHIRKVYEARFGYLLYNEPGVYRGQRDADASYYNSMRFYAKPVWQVNCLYAPGGADSLRETASYTTDERNSPDFRELFIDAQTGKLIEESGAQDRCEYKGFIGWDEAR